MFLESIFGRKAGAIGSNGWLRRTPRLAPDLLQILVRERSRADRTESEFCLLQFYDGKPGGDGAALTKIEALLKARVRATDYIGWRANEEVWLVLVDCTAEWAQALVRNLVDEHPDLDRVQWRLYHYPTDPSLHQGAPPAASGSVEGAHGTAGHGQVGAADDQITRAQALELFFEQRTPWWKRTFDVAAAGAGLAVLFPVYAATAALVRLDSAGPAFFSQLRSGRLGRSFTLYKFRSMLIDAEEQKRELMELDEQDGPAFKIENDPRVTRMGRWLRMLSLDEMPQLWNVLVGEMSVVGPRPLPVDEAARCLPWQRRRGDVAPGLTCFWQVKDRRNKIPFDEWVRLDLRYIRERSPWVDLKLILATAWVVVRRKGV